MTTCLHLTRWASRRVMTAVANLATFLVAPGLKTRRAAIVATAVKASNSTVMLVITQINVRTTATSNSSRSSSSSSSSKRNGIHGNGRDAGEVLMMTMMMMMTTIFIIRMKMTTQMTWWCSHVLTTSSESWSSPKVDATARRPI